MCTPRTSVEAIPNDSIHHSALQNRDFGHTYDRSRALVRALGPQQVDLWVRMRGKPSPHIHTYILQDQAGPWCTQLQILDLPVLELNPLNFDLFGFFTSQKGCLPPDRQKNPEIYRIKTCFVFKRVRICNFCLRCARPGIRRPWTCSCSHTYMQYSNPQIHLSWPESKRVVASSQLRSSAGSHDFHIRSKGQFKRRQQAFREYTHSLYVC